MPLLADLPRRKCPNWMRGISSSWPARPLAWTQPQNGWRAKLSGGHGVIALLNGMGFEEELAQDLGCRVERGLFFHGGHPT